MQNQSLQHPESVTQFIANHLTAAGKSPQNLVDEAGLSSYAAALSTRVVRIYEVLRAIRWGTMNRRDNQQRRHREMTMTQSTPQVSGLERFVFGLTRWMSIVAAATAVIGITFCALFLLGKFDKPTLVTYREVTAAMDAPAGADQSVGAAEPSSPTAPPDTIPESVAREFSSPENRQVLKGWLEGLDSDTAKHQFLNELDMVIRNAEKERRDVDTAVNTYKNLKFQKIGESSQSKTEALAIKGAAAAAILVLLLFIVILALVLVLLAIERHARSVAKQIESFDSTSRKIEQNTRAAALSLRLKSPAAAATPAK